MDNTILHQFRITYNLVHPIGWVYSSVTATYHLHWSQPVLYHRRFAISLGLCLSDTRKCQQHKYTGRDKRFNKVHKSAFTADVNCFSDFKIKWCLTVKWSHTCTRTHISHTVTTSTAVSYTHLDVYKRQEWEETDDPWIEHAKASPYCCLLYTSRCV